MATQLIRDFKYNDNKLHWETYEQRFRERYNSLYEKCKIAKIDIDHTYNPINRRMTVTVVGDNLDRQEVVLLIDQIKSTEQ